MTKKRSTPHRGSVLVEFAICAPLLITVFLGAWHFGYAFWQYNALEQAVRAGGRFASVKRYMSPEGLPPDPAYLSAVRNVVVYGKPEGGVQPIVAGLAPTNVFVEATFDAYHKPRLITIWVDNFTIPGLFSTVTMHGKPSVRFPLTTDPPVS